MPSQSTPSALPDMGAALRAKVAAPSCDAATLSALYDGMANAWRAQGPDADAVAATSAYYSNDGTPRPYITFTPTPLAPAAVRLLAFFLLHPDGDEPASGAAALASAAMAAADVVAAALPPSARLHRSTADGLHLTVFMTSQPFALCGNPFEEDDGEGAKEALLGPLGAPSPGVVEREVAATRALAAQTATRPTLVAHSIILARSGALLLLLMEEGDGRVVDSLRTRARAAFPRAPPTQASILHVTLGRLLSKFEDGEGSNTAVAAVADAAVAASQKVRGMRWSPPSLSHICEEVFATVAGPRADAPFGGGGS